MGFCDGGDTEIHYAPYLENTHSDMLGMISYERNRIMQLTGGFTGAVNETLTVTDNNGMVYGAPTWTAYDDLTLADIDDSFFGSGYTLTDFPAPWDMFGKFMAGLDVDLLAEQTEDRLVTGSVTTDLIAAENTYLQDDIDQTAIPRIEAHTRDINAWRSSSFINSRTLLQANKTKVISKFSADIKNHARDLAQGQTARHLDWNTRVVGTHANLMQQYWTTKFAHLNAEYEFIAKKLYFRMEIADQQLQAIKAPGTGAPIRDVSPFEKAANAVGQLTSMAASITAIAGI